MAREATGLRARVHAMAEQYRTDFEALLETLDAVALEEGDSLGRHLRSRCGRMSSAGHDPFAFIEFTAPVEDAFLERYASARAELAVLALEAERAQGIRPIRLLLAR